MALVTEHINWLQQKGHTEAEGEHFLLDTDEFQNLAQRASQQGHTLGASEAETSAGIWLSAVRPLLFPAGTRAMRTALQPDYMLLLGITLCHPVEKPAQTRQLSPVKSKAHSSLSSSWLYTSQAPGMPLLAHSPHWDQQGLSVPGVGSPHGRGSLQGAAKGAKHAAP